MQIDPDSSLKFLKKFLKDQRWVLVSIRPDKKNIATKTVKNKQELDDYLREYGEGRNVYFHVNCVSRDVKSKAIKEDIQSVHWLHVDVDPDKDRSIDEERERILSLLTDKLPKGIPSPTVIVFSGGGYQAFWKLKEPFLTDGNSDRVEEIELYNKRLEQVFGGDHCHNVDRIMRLPGTINVPDALKKKAGRVEELAVCIEFNNKSYDLSEFQKARGVQTKNDGDINVNVSSNVEPVLDLSELDQYNVTDRVKIVIAQGRHPDKPKEGDNSRSAWLFDCLCQLYRFGVPEDVIYSLITDPGWAISESVREQKNPQKYALRQMTRAKGMTEDPDLHYMNERHAIIGNIGGKCRVIEEVEDDVLGRAKLTISSFEDVRNRYKHMRVQVGSNKEGEPIFKPLGAYWLDHEKRRQYDYLKFMPDGDRPNVYNLWRGFAVEPRPGDCEMYLDLLRHGICNGDESYYDYLIKWMARAVQNPAQPGEVAVVLRGGKGTGKSFAAKMFGRLFGRHSLHISNPSHLVGNFNAHLRDVISLFADEAFYAGDRKHESVLKMLVTEDSIPIEQKGVDVEAHPNYVHLIMAANDPHVVRASGDERRYFVLEVGDKFKQKTKFFSELSDKMTKEGGLEALLFHLQSIDLNNFQVRDVPQTQALQEQKLLSMTVDEEWWFRKLKTGRILEHDLDWKTIVETGALAKDFTDYADRWKFNRRGNETALGKFLYRVAPHLEKAQRRVDVEVYDEETGRTRKERKRAWFYDFGDLDVCRRSWEGVYGQVDWEANN